MTDLAPTDLNPQHIFELNARDDLLDGLIPLEVDPG